MGTLANEKSPLLSVVVVCGLGVLIETETTGKEIAVLEDVVAL